MIKLKGHETFAIREGWLNKGMAAVENNSKVFVKSFGADALGVGSNMAKAIKYWLKAGGFIEDRGRGNVKLSRIGEIILNSDRYFEELFSYWIFHIHLVWNRENATSWYLFFNQVNIDEFSKEDIYFLLENELFRLGAENVSPRSLQDDISVLINMYMREKTENYDPEEKKISPFTRMGLIKKNGKKYRREAPEYTVLDKAAFLYGLKKYFDYKNSDVAGIDELVSEPLSPGKVFQLKRIGVNTYLDKLEEDGYIAVNRTAGLDMVYWKSEITLEEIAERYYA